MEIKIKGETITPFLVFLTGIISFIVGFYTIYLLKPKDKVGEEKRIVDSYDSIYGANLSNNNTELSLKKLPPNTKEESTNLKLAETDLEEKKVTTTKENSVQDPKEEVSDKKIKIDLKEKKSLKQDGKSEKAKLPGAKPLPKSLAIEKVIYWRCWKEGNPKFFNDCDKLPMLEKRIKERLYLLNECIDERIKDPKKKEGTLSLGIKLNFKENKINFWAGNSSTLLFSKDIARCLKEKLHSISLEKIKHNFDSYSIFFIINIKGMKVSDKGEKRKKYGKRDEIQ